jgi:hypothetical protein
VHSPLGADAATHQRHLQQIPHDIRRSLQVIDRFEQRYDRQRAALSSGGVREQSGLFGEHVRAEHVVHGMGHTQDEGPDRFAIHVIAHVVDQTKHAECLPRAGRQLGRGVPGLERSRQLFLEPVAPSRGTNTERLFSAIPRSPQGRDRLVDTHRVLPHVQAERAETENFHFAPCRARRERGQAFASRVDQGLLDHSQVRNELLHCRVTPAHRSRQSAGRVLDRHVEASQHAGQILPEDFPGIAGDDAVAVAAQLELLSQRLAKRRGDRERSLGDAQRPDQIA